MMFQFGLNQHLFSKLASLLVFSISVVKLINQSFDLCIYFILLKQDINKPFFYVLNVWKHKWWGFYWKKTTFCSNVFLRLTSLGWDYYLFFSYIYTYNLKHNASLTHVTSFRLMSPKPVGLRALGGEKPLRA